MEFDPLSQDIGMNFFLLSLLLLIFSGESLAADEANTDNEPTPAHEREREEEQKQNVVTSSLPATDRLIIFIDAFNYKTSSIDATTTRNNSEGSETTITTKRETANFTAVNPTIGLKSYHDRLILGFGISPNLGTGSNSAGGVFFAGYQLTDAWQIGGLLFLDNSEEKNEVKRDGDNPASEVNESSLVRYSFGPWAKYGGSKHWRAQMSLHYAMTDSQQTSNSSQMGNDTHIKTSIIRKHIDLNFILGPYVPITSRLTFVPQMSITCSLPLKYTQTQGSTISHTEEDLDFDEDLSIDYTLTLAGFRYEL